MNSNLLRKALPWGAAALAMALVAGALLTVGLMARGCRSIPLLLGCAVVRLPSDSLSADFYDGQQLLAAGSNTITVPVLGGQSHHLIIRKIVDSNVDPTTDYIYDDTSLDVSVTPGQSQTFVVSPPKDYQRGQLRLTCDLQSEEVGDDVVCHPLIDNAVYPDLSGGDSTTVTLATGSHTVRVELIGALAKIWTPDAKDDTLNIQAGQVAPLKETFTRLTQLTIDIDRSGVVGDLFLDGKLIGSQVSSAQAYVMPNASYTVVGSNFVDPAANGLYRWNTIGVGVDVTGEVRKVVTLPMDRQDLTGVVTVGCNLAGYKTTDVVTCEIPVDGGEPISRLSPGQTADLHLRPGVHTLSISLTGPDAGKWSTPDSQHVTVKTGESTTVAFVGRVYTAAPPPPPTAPPVIGIPTVVPTGAPTGPQPTPTFTPKPPSIYTGTLSNFGANARAIFLRGQAMGRDPKKFAKIGDCETDSPYFLIPFDNGIYKLGNYTYLDPMVKYYAGSYSRSSVAGKGSFVVASVLDPQWADPSVCQGGETPLACEYRVWNPSVALIMLRTYPYPWQDAQRNKYISDMRTVIDYTISQGIVPVLSTIPLILPSPDELHDMNNIIRGLADEYNIPLWDFYATLSTLPDNGIDDTSHLTVPIDGGTTFLGDDMNYGMTHRNLESLEVLHDFYHNVAY